LAPPPELVRQEMEQALTQVLMPAPQQEQPEQQVLIERHRWNNLEQHQAYIYKFHLALYPYKYEPQLDHQL